MTLTLKPDTTKKATLQLESDSINADKLTRNFAKRNRADFESLHQRTTNTAEAKNLRQSDLTKSQLD